MRYDHLLTNEEPAAATKTCGGDMSMHNARMMPFLAELGERYAARTVRVEHLL